MAEIKKMTQREVLNYMLGKYADDSIVTEYATHQIEVLDKKASSKKSSAGNEELKNLILAELGKFEKGVTVTELITSSEVLATYKVDDKPLSNQRVSNILNKMVDEKIVTKVTDKKKSYFSVSEG